jgi:hypothetical protein
MGEREVPATEPMRAHQGVAIVRVLRFQAATVGIWSLS